jgi:OOP family OmpA-OmpF porin
MKTGNRIARLGAVLVAGSIALGSSSATFAQDGRLYFGASFGQAEANDFCRDVNDIFTGFGITPTGCDEKDGAFKLFGGFQVNRNFAIEASYFDYGSVRANGDLGGFPVTLSASATAFGVAALVTFPVAERFSLFGKAGLLFSDADILISGAGTAVAESDSETGLHIGIGALFNATDKVGIRAEWERNDELEIDMISVGVQVRF